MTHPARAPVRHPGRHAVRLETIGFTVPTGAVEAYEAALQAACDNVSLFLVEGTEATGGLWRLEGVKPAGAHEPALADALLLAGAATGIALVPERRDTETDGWLARVCLDFPEQFVGRRFAIRGTHLPPARHAGRHVLWLDAGVAFGSGEHGSTRGCLRALERVAARRPRRILDLGTGSGILAMAAARLLRRPVLAADLDPWSVRVARENACANQLHRLVRTAPSRGWAGPAVRRGAPYDLVFANILARPLCGMARSLALHLSPGGVAILAGLLRSQERMVLAAHRRVGLVLAGRVREGEWTTLVLRQEYG